MKPAKPIASSNSHKYVLHAALALAASFCVASAIASPKATLPDTSEGKLGAKSGGEGFYKDGEPNVEGDADPDPQELSDLFVLKSLVESCALLEEGVSTIRELDLGMMAGAGLDPRRGLFPPFWKADLEGLDTMLEKLEAYEESHGERFAPPRILKRLVAQGRLGLKAGHGFEECRKRLGLEQAAAIDVVAEDPAEADGPGRRLPTPVFVQLRRRKPAPPTPETPMPDMLARLDATLKLLEDKDRQNQVLQAKLLVAYDEITKLSATAAAHQERALGLQGEVQRLHGELKLLAPPPPPRPWWKLW